IQFDVRDPELIDIGERMIVDAGFDRSRIGGTRLRFHAGERQTHQNQGSSERRHYWTAVWDCDAGGASARPPSNSLKVFSSTSNPVLPSQLEPAGSVFSTSSDLPITSSI